MSYKTTALLLTTVRKTIQRIETEGDAADPTTVARALEHLWSAYDQLDAIAHAQLAGGGPSLAHAQ